MTRRIAVLEFLRVRGGGDKYKCEFEVFTCVCAAQPRESDVFSISHGSTGFLHHAFLEFPRLLVGVGGHERERGSMGNAGAGYAAGATACGMGNAGLGEMGARGEGENV